jgi:hypothetical protein
MSALEPGSHVACLLGFGIYVVQAFGLQFEETAA